MNKLKTVRAANPPTTAINQRGTRLLVSAIKTLKFVNKTKKLLIN